jgi:hypothetical protein
MTKTLNTTKFIKGSRKQHGDRFGYNKSVYINTRTDIIKDFI